MNIGLKFKDNKNKIINIGLILTGLILFNLIIIFLQRGVHNRSIININLLLFLIVLSIYTIEKFI